MVQTVSITSIVCMAFTLLISVGIPLGALFLFQKKTGGSLLCTLIGAGTFIVFALILEAVFHQVIQGIFGEKLTGNIWLYALYGGLAAALFEETGRFLSMRFLMKKTLSKENSILYGIGHGGVESVLLVGLSYVSNLITAILIDLGKLDEMLSGLDESLKGQVLEKLSALWTTPAYLFLLGGIERMLAFALQICLSYLVYRAVKYRKASLILLPFGIHFAVDAGIVLLSKAVPVYVVECVLAAAVATLSILIFRQYRAEKAVSL